VPKILKLIIQFKSENVCWSYCWNVGDVILRQCRLIMF